MRNVILVAALALAVAPGCSKKSHASPRKDTKTNTQKSAAPTPAPAPKPAAPASAAQAPSSAEKGPTVELKLDSVKNQMKYDKTKLTVKTGAKVHLTFHNESTLDVLPHNWVLVKAGTEAKVAKAELASKADGYVAANPDIIAHTPLAEKGKTVETTFTAPAPGTYPYICTVPGHYMVMHGQLVVTP
jgi:azurin